MRLHLGFSGVVAAAAAIAVLTVVMPTDPAPAQELPAAKETIFARKILMGAIDRNMDEVETMLAPEGKLELADAQEHSETISTMLMVFPHMFPPTTNQWKAGAARNPANRHLCLTRCMDEFRVFLPARHGSVRSRGAPVARSVPPTSRLSSCNCASAATHVMH